MSYLNCTCGYLKDLCEYFQPPDPPPLCNVESIETFRNNHDGWKEYKKECLRSTSSPSINEECLHSTTSPSNKGDEGESRDRQHNSGVPVGAIIGIVLIMIICILIIILVIYLVKNPKKRQKLWNDCRRVFQYKGKINASEVQLTYQEYNELNFLHSKAVKGEIYKKKSSSSEVNFGFNTDTAFDGAYTDSNSNQNQPNQLSCSTVNKHKHSPASHHPYSNIPPSMACKAIADVNSENMITQLSLERTKDCTKGQEETRDTLTKKRPQNKKNHLKRRMVNSMPDFVHEMKSVGKKQSNTM